MEPEDALRPTPARRGDAGRSEIHETYDHTVPGAATVSVAIPVYNGERYLAEAITSVLGQSLSATEFKVYDNCSTDATLTVARRLLPEVDVIRSSMNRGAVANFNQA